MELQTKQSEDGDLCYNKSSDHVEYASFYYINKARKDSATGNVYRHIDEYGDSIYSQKLEDVVGSFEEPIVQGMPLILRNAYNTYIDKGQIDPQ